MVRGALHVHTDLSRDGLWPISEMAAFFRSKHYQFVCITEHSEDIDDEKREFLRRSCAELSNREFCLVPGVEYGCSSRLHIAGIGCDAPLDTSDPVAVANSIRAVNGFAVLAHPGRIKWQCPDALLKAVNAVEAWNVGYDSRFVPRPTGIEFLDHARAVNPAILASAGLDLHARRGFYPVAIKTTVDRLDQDSILRALITGNYLVQSPFWSLHAHGRMSSGARLRLRVLRSSMEGVRSLRDRFEGRGKTK